MRAAPARRRTPPTARIEGASPTGSLPGNHIFTPSRRAHPTDPKHVPRIARRPRLRVYTSQFINFGNTIDFVRRTIVSVFPSAPIGVNVLFRFDPGGDPMTATKSINLVLVTVAFAFIGAIVVGVL